MIKIGIVDDKSLNRKMIRQNLEEHEDVKIMLEAVNGHDFLDKLSHLPLEDQPQLVLVDLDMPGMNGIDTIAIATIKYPSTKFLVLTIFDDDDKIFDAIKAGASGYLLKDDAPVLLIDAIYNAYQLNGAPMSPAIARKALQLLKASKPSDNKDNAGPIINLLSDREQELLKLLIEGYDYKKIALQLFISPQTVRTHISHIYEKLHINSKAEAIILAHKYNWRQ